MKKILLLIAAILFGNILQAQHSCSRNKSAVKYRNDYMRITCSRNTSFELRQGRLYGWGSNVTGGLGIGNVVDQYQPIQTGLDSNWKTIVTGSVVHTLAIKSDGSLWAWGANNYGQLGQGNNTEQHSPVQVGIDHDWKQIDLGDYHSIGLKADGSLWTWGLNQNGQLGQGDILNRNTPTQVGTDHDWVSIAAGVNCVWALKADGSLWGWGQNNYGQLGQGDEVTRTSPVQIGSSRKWVLLTNVNGSVFIGLQSDGSIWGCGSNNGYCLGLGDTARRLSLVQLNADHDWAWVANGGNTMALKGNGTLWGWGGDDGFLGLGNGTDDYAPYPVQINNSNDWVSIAADMKTFAMKSGSNIWTTGINDYGQLGLGFANFQIVDTYTATSTPAREWISGAIGSTHSAALYSDGTLWTWGNNAYGQLGLGNTTEQHEPVQMGTDTAWTAVMAGSQHTLAMKCNGTLWAWGRNNNGQLGNGNNTEQHSPVQVTGTWASIAAGDAHSMALKADGTLWAWGNNSYGQLGKGNYTNYNAPTQVGTGDTWIGIATGEGHTLGLKADGTLWAWGNNIYGQLGTGNFTSQNAPVQVGTDDDWTAITAGANHSMALKADGTLWTWGRNADGQLGNGNNSNSNSPLQVSGSNWIAVNAGNAHSIAYRADGSIWSWGNNAYGQLGLGNNNNQNTPQTVTQPAIVHMFTGPSGDHTGVIKDTRSLICLAGKNDHGQLGDSTTVGKNTFSCLNECVIPIVTITVNPNDTICTGDTVVFTATASNGGPTPVYQWYKNNTPVGNNNTLYTANGNLNNGDVIKCVMTGSAACSVYPTDTSNLITITTVNTVTPTISIAADMGDTICQEHILTYNATITNGGLNPVYQWYEDNIAVGGNTPTHTPNQVSGTVVKCQLTSSATCATPQSVMSTPHTMLITPVTTPQVTVTADPGTLITQNQSVTFTATVTNAVNPQYQWKKNAANLAGETQSTYTTNTLQNGDIISCRVRGLSMCDTGYGSPQVITVFPVGFGEVAVGQQQFAVWPNPVKGDLFLGLTPALSKGEGGIMVITVCDVVGRELVRTEWDGKGEKQIDMKGLASGVYMLRISSNNGMKLVRKIVKE